MARRTFRTDAPAPHSWAPAFTAAILLALFAAPLAAQGLPGTRLKDGASVRRAFAEVVADAARATVRVEVGGKPVALGTIVDAAGYVLTKASELNGPAAVCFVGEDRHCEAQVVGVHHDFDLALLKIEASDLPAIRWRDGDVPEVGQILATPDADQGAVAVGVLSVRERRIPRRRGVLGISIQENEAGPEITQIFPDSGAAQAGLKVGDIITKVAGSAIKTGRALSENIRRYRPGDRLKLLVVRGEEQREVEAILGTPGLNPFDRGDIQNQMGGQLSRVRGGFPQTLQHDTVLRPEDCGGPVVDLSGRAVGINIARAGRTETYAVPAAAVLALIDDLKSGRLAPPPVEPLGVPPTPEVAGR
ncbi:MAG: PDZ domain-containing protein [Planctomycetes bacterium]|nr:PDZ domain-containing protein [Planctomycetota bacterium]